MFEKIKTIPAPIQIVLIIAITITSIVLITNITVMLSQNEKTCTEDIGIEIEKTRGIKEICKSELEQKTIQLTIKNTGNTEISATSLLLMSNSGTINEEQNVLKQNLKPEESIEIIQPYNLNNLIYVQIVPGFKNGDGTITCYHEAIKETIIKNC